MYLTFKNSPVRNSPGLLRLLRWVLFQGSHLQCTSNLIESTVLITYDFAATRNIFVRNIHLIFLGRSH